MMEFIKAIDVSSHSSKELDELKKHYEQQGYKTVLQIYQGFVDTWVLEIYEEMK